MLKKIKGNLKENSVKKKKNSARTCRQLQPHAEFVGVWGHRHHKLKTKKKKMVMIGCVPEFHSTKEDFDFKRWIAADEIDSGEKNRCVLEYFSTCGIWPLEYSRAS